MFVVGDGGKIIDGNVNCFLLLHCNDLTLVSWLFDDDDDGNDSDDSDCAIWWLLLLNGLEQNSEWKRKTNSLFDWFFSILQRNGKFFPNFHSINLTHNHKEY